MVVLKFVWGTLLSQKLTAKKRFLCVIVKLQNSHMLFPLKNDAKICITVLCRKEMRFTVIKNTRETRVHFYS